MELFDIIKVIFNKTTEFDSLNPGEKRKHFFMVNRRFAIQFPLQANVLQHLKINQSAVVDYWHVFLSSKYDYQPSWIYTKGVKKSVEVKEKKLPVSNNLIIEYCKYNNVDFKAVKDALIFFPNDMISEIKQFEILSKQK